MSALSELTGNYTIDPAHSQVGFVVRHAMVTNVRGAFDEFQGTVDASNGIESAKVDLTIDVKSINTRNAARDEHLRNSDFFDADQFGQITFRSTQVKVTGDTTLEVTGDLTIKGNTQAVTIPFTFGGAGKDAFGADRVGFQGTTVINRKDFGVTWNAPLETGGVMLGEKITLELELSATKNA